MLDFQYQSIAWFHQQYLTNPDYPHWLLSEFMPLFVTKAKQTQALRYLDDKFLATQLANLQQRNTQNISPLLGVPLAHKELFKRKNWANEAGSKSRQGMKADETAFVITQLDKAGALDIARLTSVEYGLGITGHNQYAGTPPNPYNESYIAGGSSSGSAVMVANGFIPASLGTDTGGSVRLPAAACGLVGLKPSYDIISRAGVFCLSESLDTVGTLTRNVNDANTMFDSITGNHQPSAMPNNIKHLRIAIGSQYFFEDCDNDIVKIIEPILSFIKTQNNRLFDIQLKNIESTNDLTRMIIAYEAKSKYGDIVKVRKQDFNAQTILRIEEGFTISEQEYDKIMRHRADFIRSTINDVFAKTDIIITPVWPFALPTIKASDAGASPDAPALISRAGHNTRPFNFLGFPCICIPIGFDKNNNPVSLQMVAKPLHENDLFLIAHHLEQYIGFRDVIL
ncbi:MAG: amidase [Alphaproteobacteria bacterium]|nr:amidase [Alphaproteobacteria bacterium]